MLIFYFSFVFIQKKIYIKSLSNLLIHFDNLFKKILLFFLLFYFKVIPFLLI